MEKVSGLELDWYKEYMVYSTKTIDYAIDTVINNRGSAVVGFSKKGEMPMPLDITIVTKNGKEHLINIPLRIMRGDKSTNTEADIKVAEDWPWVYPFYELDTQVPYDSVKSVHIDKKETMADADRTNNDYLISSQ